MSSPSSPSSPSSNGSIAGGNVVGNVESSSTNSPDIGLSIGLADDSTVGISGMSGLTELTELTELTIRENSSEKEKRARKMPIQKIINMLENEKVDFTIKISKAVRALQFHIKPIKKRAPSVFNYFVKAKMEELKTSGLSTHDRMKECSRLWKVEKSQGQ